MEESKNIKVTLQGDDNLSNYNNCGVEILIPKKELIDFLEEEGRYYKDSDDQIEYIDDDDFKDWNRNLRILGGFEHLIESYSKEECVVVYRHNLQIIEREKPIHYETIELETINTPKEKYKIPEKDLKIYPKHMRDSYKKKGYFYKRKQGVYEELNKDYHKKAYNNYPDPTEYNIMDEKEIENFEKENDWFDGDPEYGVDVYTIENFDLDLELKTGWI